MAKLPVLITRIDIDAGAERKNYLVQAKQGDKATRFVSVLIVEDGKEYAPPEDADLIANFKKPDGKFAYNAAKIDDGNRILVELTNQVLAVPGEVVCEVEIRAKDSSQILTSCTFTVEVGRSNRNEAAILSSNEMTAFDTKWAEINANMEEWTTAERLRVEAEQKRAEAETARVNAETARVTAENKRQTDTQAAIERAENATKEAENALKNQAELAEQLLARLDGKLDTPANTGAAGQVPVLQPDGSTLWGSVAGGTGTGGTVGADGGYYTPSVDDAGNLSWTASKTDMPAVNGANIMGPAGADGQPGADGAPGPVGATPNIQIGTVETLAAGSAATASMTGTAENPMLNLGIPKGADGQPGADGKDGLDGSPGADGKSAYQYAVEGGYTGTEAEFAAKLAEEMPDALPNPHALTFTGAVTGSYDGSAPVSVEIPSLGSSGVGKSWRLIRTIDIVSGTSSYSFDSDNNGNQFAVKNFMILIPSFPIGGGSYLEIKPNNYFVYTQIQRGAFGNYFCFSMEQISDGYYLIHNMIDNANSKLHSAYLSKQYDSFVTFSSFGFWFSTSVTADTTMYVLGVDA